MTQIVTDSSTISDAATALSTQRGEFSAAHQALFKVVADSSEYWKDNAGASYISEVTPKFDSC